jgi:hypothetical protein
LGLRRLAGNQFIEVALLTFRGAFLVQQGKTVFIKGLKPVVPRYLFQRALAAESREVEANHADIAVSSGSAHACWRSTTLFRPLPNLIMISCYI